MTLADPPPVVAVVGATATGKSDLAVELALRLGGEVVNADSMQLYRGMDVGTAKLTDAERRGVPHHLLDVWDVRVAANVADYQRLVRPALLEIAARGRRAVLVGGSGLYVRAALDDLAVEMKGELDGQVALAGGCGTDDRDDGWQIGGGHDRESRAGGLR